MDYQNQNNYNVQNKRQGNGIIIFIVVVLVIVLGIIFIRPFISYLKAFNNVKQSAAEDVAYSIISAVELAKASFLLENPDKEILTLEDVRKGYDDKNGTWNEDNTITSEHYDVVCKVKTNANIEMFVSCDVNGKIVESNPISLKIETNSGNTENNTTQDNTQNNNATNNTQNSNNNQTNNNTSNVISYRIFDKNADFKEMYVNNKLVEIPVSCGSLTAEQLSDVLIVNCGSFSSNVLYAVDKNANIIGQFGTMSYGQIPLIITRASIFRGNYKISGNSLYVKTFTISGQTVADYCMYSDDEIVVYEEKFEYLENNKFSNPVLTSTKTRKEERESRNIVCN